MIDTIRPITITEKYRPVHNAQYIMRVVVTTADNARNTGSGTLDRRDDHTPALFYTTTFCHIAGGVVVPPVDDLTAIPRPNSNFGKHFSPHKIEFVFLVTLLNHVYAVKGLLRIRCRQHGDGKAVSEIGCCSRNSSFLNVFLQSTVTHISNTSVANTNDANESTLDLTDLVSLIPRICIFYLKAYTYRWPF